MRRDRVGIRELRQNLSVYVRRVREGDTFEVTERGQPVALLSPLPEEATPLARLVREGRARPPAADLLDLGAPSGRVSRDASRALKKEREDRL